MKVLDRNKGLLKKNLINITRINDVALADIEGKGRGVIATALIPAGTVIEVSPAIPVESLSLSGTIINDYTFSWENSEAIVFGITSFINHSVNANCSIDYDCDNFTMELTSTQDIKPGEELLYDYDCDLWFEVTE